MKKTILFTLAAGMSFLIFSSISNNPSIVAGNRTGVLGSSTANCSGSGCHNDTSGFTTPSIIITKGNGTAVTSYQADSTYVVTIDAQTGANFPQFGMQISAKTVFGQIGGSFIPSNSLVQNFAGGFEILEQTQPLPATSFGRLNKTFFWTAPSIIGEGAITFYAIVLASNNDNTSNGDLYAASQRTLSENPLTSIKSLLASFHLTAFPNPCNEVLNLSFENDGANEVSIKCFNLLGQLVFNETHAVKAGNNSISFYTSRLPAGNYLLHFSAKNKGEKVLSFVKE